MSVILNLTADNEREKQKSVEQKKKRRGIGKERKTTAGIAFAHANNNYIISYELHCKCGFFDTTDIYARLPHRAVAAAVVIAIAIAATAVDNFCIERKAIGPKLAKIIDRDFFYLRCVSVCYALRLLVEPFVLIRPILRFNIMLH